MPEAKLPTSAPLLLAQVTTPVYPVPAVVVLTGVAPVTGAVTPAMAFTEIILPQIAQVAPVSIDRQIDLP